MEVANLDFVRRIVFFCILLCLHNLSLGQPHTVKNLGLSEGLSNVHVVDLVTDKNGFVWVATEFGLHRFAGNTFDQYYKTDTLDGSSVNSNEINKLLYSAKDNKLYIATRANGLNVLDLDKGVFSYFMHDDDNPESIATNDVTDLLQDKNGHLWLTTYHRGLQFFDTQKKIFKRYDSSTIRHFPDNSIWSVTQDDAGVLYLGLVDKGLAIFDPSTLRVQHITVANSGGILPNDEIKVVYCDQNNFIWLGTRTGLAVYNTATKALKRVIDRFPHKQEAPFIYSIREVGEQLWVGTDDSYIFTVATDEDMWQEGRNPVVKAWQQEELGAAATHQIVADRYGNIWTANYGLGVGFISHLPSYFEVFPHAVNGKTVDKYAMTYSGLMAQDKGLWAATEGHGLIHFEGNSISEYTSKNSGLRDDHIYASHKDLADRIWLGLRNGGVSVYHIDQQRWDYLDYQGRLREVRVIYSDREGCIWMGAKGGVYIYSPEKATFDFLAISGSSLGDYAARAMVEDDLGHTWIGTFGQGIFVYDKDRRLVKKIDSRHGGINNTINHLYKDRVGNIWIATNDGVVLVEKGDWHRGLKRNSRRWGGWQYVHAISEDQRGNMWLSTNTGIVRYDVRSNRFNRYDDAYGVPMGGFRNGSTATDFYGRIVFGGLSQLTVFDPEKIPMVAQETSLAFSRFTVFQRKGSADKETRMIPASRSIRLMHDENMFRVEFGVTDYALNGLVDYSYQLYGVDDVWHDLGNEHSLDFRNLSYGNYTLRVRAKLRNQQWDNKFISLSFEIVPPFYWTGYAKVAYVLAFSFLIALFLRFYTRKLHLETALKLKNMEQDQQQRLHAERLNFFTNITHELRTPLTVILGPLEDLIQDNVLDKKQAHLIRLVQKNANRLFNLVNQLLEFRKVETQHKSLVLGEGKLGELVKDITLKYIDLNAKKKVSVRCDVPDQDATTRYDGEIINMVLDNLLSNAMKYTDEGVVEVTLRYQEDDQINQWAILSVRDTGIGISKEYQEKVFERFYQVPDSSVGNGTGLGLSLVRDLVKIHQGKITLLSVPGQGSTFTIQLPTQFKDPVSSSALPASPVSVGPIQAATDRQIILLVEDDIDLRSYLSAALSTQYTVLEAADGRQGLALAGVHIPDMIISDIMMPYLDGFELLAELRKSKDTSHIPVILLTAKDTEGDRKRGYSLGVDSYLSKPITTKLLLERIHNIFERRRAIYVSSFAEQQTDLDVRVSTVESLPEMSDEVVWKENKFVQEVMHYIEERLEHQVLDVHMIAEAMNMSHSTLYRKIKAITGKSINQFVRMVRMQKAASLLQEGTHNITQVSFMVGINNVIYFRQCFKEEFGVLPSEYQKKSGG